MVAGSRKLLHTLVIIVLVIYAVLLVTTYSKLLNYAFVFFVSVAAVYVLAKFFKIHVGVFTLITALILVLVSLYTLFTINVFYLYYYIIGLGAVLVSVFIISKYTHIQFTKRHHRVDIALIASVIIYGLLIAQYLTGQIVGTELNFSDNLTLTAAKDMDYTWYPENKGKLNSLKLSCELSGNVKVYLVDEDGKTSYLILDSASIKTQQIPSTEPLVTQSTIPTQVSESPIGSVQPETSSTQSTEPAISTPSPTETTEPSLSESPTASVEPVATESQYPNPPPENTEQASVDRKSVVKGK